jgi:hypothetical protein
LAFKTKNNSRHQWIHSDLRSYSWHLNSPLQLTCFKDKRNAKQLSMIQYTLESNCTLSPLLTSALCESGWICFKLWPI